MARKMIGIPIMRAIDINEKVMTEALRRSGARTTGAAVKEGLRAQIQIRRQSGVRSLRGKVKWEGDLDAMRTSRQPIK